MFTEWGYFSENRFIPFDWMTDTFGSCNTFQPWLNCHSCDGGGGGVGGAEYRGTLQSPQQQCEAAAHAKQEQTSLVSFVHGVKRASKSVVGSTVSGAVGGCLFDAETGCVPGAVGGALVGAIGGLLQGAGQIAYYGFTGIYNSEKQMQNDLAACRQGARPYNARAGPAKSS